MLHHPLRLEAVLFSTIQKEAGQRRAEQKGAVRTAGRGSHLNGSAEMHPTQKHCAEYWEPMAALRFITATRHQRGWITRFSIRQRRGKRPPDTTFPGGWLAAGPKRIRRARFRPDKDGVRSHGAQLPVLSSKRTLAQLKIQHWGRAVALKDTAAAATIKKKERDQLHISSGVFVPRIQIRVLLRLQSEKQTVDKRKRCASDLCNEARMWQLIAPVERNVTFVQTTDAS